MFIPFKIVVYDGEDPTPYINVNTIYEISKENNLVKICTNERDYELAFLKTKEVVDYINKYIQSQSFNNKFNEFLKEEK